MVRRIHLVLLFVEPCLSRLVLIPVIPVRKTIIIWFALCGTLWLLMMLSACCRSLQIVALEVLGLSLFLDLPLDFCKISLEATADFHCLSLEYPLDAGLGT